ncbi:MAG: T9SS type A sorting domain-containing protein [Bacteroidaceae bacterium]|nr:T9SS type A sorting domain-containing protein [Bacteroidaceae bacterium]
MIRLKRSAILLFALLLGFGYSSDLCAQTENKGNQKTINLRTKDGREFQFKFSKFLGIKCELHELTVSYGTGDVEEITVSELTWPKNDYESAYYKQEVYKTEVVGTVTVNVDDGAVITFTDQSTGIKDMPAEAVAGKTRIEMRSATELHVYGMMPTDRIHVYAMNGSTVKAQVSTSGNEADVSLAALPAGIYVVKVNKDCTIKIQKR